MWVAIVILDRSYFWFKSMKLKTRASPGHTMDQKHIAVFLYRGIMAHFESLGNRD